MLFRFGSFTIHRLWPTLGLALLVMAGMVLAPQAIAQGSQTPRLAGTLVFQTASGGDIYAINADGTNLRYLTTGMDPALSPDGQGVAFTRWEGPQHGAPGSLWVVINVDALAGTGERVILSDVQQPKAPVWSPDGSQITISMQQGGRLQSEQKCSHSLPTEPVVDKEDIRVVVEIGDNGAVDTKFCYTLLPHPYWGLRLVDVASGAFQDLPGDLFSYAPAWDPANDWHLVYEGEMGLVNLDLNQGTTWPLTDDVGDHTPVFSPDGSKIAVSYRQHDHWEIHVLNADGSGRVRLTKTPLRVIVEQQINGEEQHSWNNVAPAWSPDGSQIAFLTDRTGAWEIWTMNADGSNQRPMFPNGALDGLTFNYAEVDERMISWR
jgi:Tol biopolymer transport system component